MKGWFLFSILILAFFGASVKAQMQVGQSLLYGNEWVKQDQQYVKVKIAEEGIYKLTGANIQALGINITSIKGNQWQLFHNGQEQPLYVSTSDVYSEEEFLVFYAKENGSELDKFLFQNDYQDMLNPGYSLVSDTAAYFLTWTDSEPVKRYTIIPNLTDIDEFPQQYYFETITQRLTNSFVKRPNGVGSLSRFSAGEGFAGAAITNRSTTFPVTNLFVDGPDATLEIRMTSNNSRDHELLYTFNGNELDRKNFNNWNFLSDLYKVPTAQLLPNNTFSSERLGAAENRYFPAFYELSYPREFVWNGFTHKRFTIEGAGDKVLEWSGNLPDNIWLFDVENTKLMIVDEVESPLRLGFEQSQTSNWVQSSMQSFKSPMHIQLKTFPNFSDWNGDYILMYHPELRMSAIGIDPIQEYEAYRNSTGYQVIPVDVTELYDLFSYGIDRHFLALRNFHFWVRSNYPSIEHVCIVGKGREFRNIRTTAQIASAQGSFYIPTFGAPGSDQLLVCEDDSVNPILAIGRIPVQSGDELLTYLDKVKSYEQAQSFPIAEEDREWMKRVIHLSGGNTASEREQLRQIMVRTGRILENGLLQQQIIPFAKLSSEPVEENVPTQIYDLINQGVSMISFLGHSGSTTIDFNIENYNRYANKDKYFLFLALGCSVGNIHINGISLGERFVFEKDKAAVAFLASAGLGYPSILENYAGRIYDYLGNDNTRSIGKLFRDVHQSFSNTGNRFFQEQLEQMTINGDPALRYNYPEGPDFKLEFSSVRIKEGNVNISQDSMTIEVEVRNLGSRYDDIIDLEIVRIYPDGRVDSIITSFEMNVFRKSLEIRLPVGGEGVAGNNRLLMEINPARIIPEKPDPEAYINNRLRNVSGEEGFPFFIYGVSASPSWPVKLAVINDLRPTLTAVTGNLFAAKSRYIFEIDTSDQFESDFKLRHSIESNGGVLSWQLDQNLLDHTTYYWRISGDSISAEAAYNWEYSSFSIASDEQIGISMRHEDQFKAIENPTFRQDSALGWTFGQVNRTLEIKNQLFLNNSNPSGSIEGFQYGSMFPWNVLHQGVLVQVLDPVTGVSWRNPPGGRYGSLNTTPSTFMFAFPYDTREATQRKSLIDFLSDTIPDGSIVFLYSIQRIASSDFAPEQWAIDSVSLSGKNIFNILEAEGAVGMRNLEEKGSVPFILGYVKGIELIEERYANEISEVIDIVYTYLERTRSGTLEWKPLPLFTSINDAKWNILSSIQAEQDSVQVRFSVLKNLGETPESYTSNNELEGQFSISSNAFPTNMQFSLAADNPGRYAPQLTQWTVSGELLPDLTFFRSRQMTVRDTLEGGEVYPFSIVLKNIGGSMSDSTSLVYRVRSLNETLQDDTIMVGTLDIFEERVIDIEISTSSLSGVCFIDFVIDPSNEILELRTDNNFGSSMFFVRGDDRNPLVDVYFDGKQIMDGDLISSKPEIRIQLRDDNPYFPLNDTSLFAIRIRKPDQMWHSVNFSEEGISFLPASSGEQENLAEVLIQKPFEQDGEYVLEVMARDIQGNPSGSQPYQKRFQVINQQMVSNIVNYPNPFSTATRFVYTLTGSTSPDYFKIQIYSLSGQLVREINHLEIGPLRVGTHVTDYVWDGTDHYGQMLANGVYLYRLQTQNQNEEQVEHFETRLDQFITNGWSKMVILR